ncbi:MAG: glutamyl-tRNA reductase [Parvicellaceae bacterium]
MREIKIIGLTHKSVELEKIGEFHVDDSSVKARLKHLVEKTDIEELVYLSTCNRVEFIFTSEAELDDDCLLNFFHSFDPDMDETKLQFACQNAELHSGLDAVRHLFKVASSIDSLILGEREIITQVRTAYERSREIGLTGDSLRLLIEKTIEAAKAVFTQTNVATKPVSVVSLAYRNLKDFNIPLESKVVVVGAGKTNSTMCKFLKKHGFTNFVVYNRTMKNGDALAKELNCENRTLAELKNHSEGFDLIVSCTGSSKYIFTPDLYRKVLGDDKGKKVVIDLAIPNDVDREIADKFNVRMITVEALRSVAEKNLKEREKELVVCDKIIQNSLDEFRTTYRERQIELAMKNVPQQVKEIKEMAMGTVFINELNSLDSDSKEVLDKVIEYMEKKYIAGPMKMAKEILLDNPSSKV